MKGIGIIRRVDELGRIVIPKEIRSGLKIKPGDCLEVFCDGNNIVINKKDLVKKSIETLDNLLKTINSILNIEILITDNSKYLYGIGKKYQKLISKTIDDDISSMIFKRKTIIKNDYNFYMDNINFILQPIIINGDILGSLILIDYGSKISEKHEMISKIIVKLLSNNIEL